MHDPHRRPERSRYAILLRDLRGFTMHVSRWRIGLRAFREERWISDLPFALFTLPLPDYSPRYLCVRACVRGSSSVSTCAACMSTTCARLSDVLSVDGLGYDRHLQRAITVLNGRQVADCKPNGSICPSRRISVSC